MAVTVSIQAAQADLASLVERAVAGEEIVISKSGKAAVRLVVVEAARRPRNGGASQSRSDSAIDPLSEDIRRVFASRYRE